MHCRTPRKALLILLVAFILFGSSLVGCSNISNTGKGAGIGAGAGAIIGGIIADNTAKGAIIGAAVGGAAGAIIGSQMDKQAKELEEEIPGAEIERVGEGIQITFDSAILFGFDSAELQTESKSNLRNLASSLQKYPNTEVTIIGHTDSVGSEEYNQQLSERRSASARAFLVREGVAPDRVLAVGRGETEPVASNETDLGRSQNRRVEFAIFASQEYRDQLNRESGK